MDDLNYNLSLGNPALCAQIVSKLVDRIKSIQKDNILDTPEFNFLTDKCLHLDPVVARTACNGLITLIKEKPSIVQFVLADFMTKISSSKCFAGLIYLINSLLLVDLKTNLKKNGTYKCKYNLNSPQHPFIAILNENKSAWSHIYKEMKNTLNILQAEQLHYWFQLYRPVILYVMCSAEEDSLDTFRVRLGNLLMNFSDIVEELLCWIEFNHSQSINDAGTFLNEVLEVSLQKNTHDLNILIPWHTSFLFKTLCLKEDPIDAIQLLGKAISSYGDSLVCINYSLLMLAKSLELCPIMYLADLLNLCKIAAKQKYSNPIIVQSFKPSLLQWITYKSKLATDSIKIAQEMLSFTVLKKYEYKVSCNLVTTKFKEMAKADSDVYFSVKMAAVVESWENSEDVLRWLNLLDNVPNFFLTNITNTLFTLFLCDFGDSRISIKSLKLLLNYASSNKAITSHLFILILYKLSNSIDPELQFELLKALPKMAVQRVNIGKVCNTIFALTKGPDNLSTFSLSLAYDLWRINEKCYSFLEKVLAAKPEKLTSSWEYNVTKAHILKEICLKRPELYGKDMVAHLSKILNECNDDNGAIASALAIEGITVLCKEGTIDIVTTWATLEPKFRSELRVPVIKSLCQLMLTISVLPYAEAYPDLIQNVIAKLWNYVTTSAELEIIDNAFDALSHFSFEQICSQFPLEYLESDGMKSKDSLEKLHELHCFPGKSWLNLLKKLNPLKLVADFLIKLIRKEISEYLKYVYQTKKANVEPSDFSYLPIHSCVRSVGEYLKCEATRWNGSMYDAVYVECLRIFSQKYSKPLPPFDWCFLQELIHDSKVKKYCIAIASKQVMLSGSARRLMENYLIALTEKYDNVQEVLALYENIEDLGNSIQPMIFKPFFDRTINYQITLFREQNNENVLEAMIQHLTDFLRNQEIQETNKLAVAEVIKEIVDKITIADQLFDMLVECVSAFPSKYLSLVSSPKCTTDLSEAWFNKAIKIRCEAVRSSLVSPLNWLNELIECADIFKVKQSFILQEFALVFQKHINNLECALWLLELIEQIQFQVADKANISHLLFRCDVMLTAVIVFSGHSIFIKDNDYTKSTLLDLFPRAVATLLEVNHWSICTMHALDSFFYMNTDTYIPEDYRYMFGRSLQALRNVEEFKKNLRWIKYLNTEIKTES